MKSSLLDELLVAPACGVVAFKRSPKPLGEGGNEVLVA
jgi:hypothetical protein